MSLLDQLIQYLQDNPSTAVGLGVGLVVAYFALNWKPKRTRQAEQQLSRMLRERDDHYRETRPPGR